MHAEPARGHGDRIAMERREIREIDPYARIGDRHGFAAREQNTAACAKASGNEWRSGRGGRTVIVVDGVKERFEPSSERPRPPSAHRSRG